MMDNVVGVVILCKCEPPFALANKSCTPCVLCFMNIVTSEILIKITGPLARRFCCVSLRPRQSSSLSTFLRIAAFRISALRRAFHHQMTDSLSFTDCLLGGVHEDFAKDTDCRQWARTKTVVEKSLRGLGDRRQPSLQDLAASVSFSGSES